MRLLSAGRRFLLQFWCRWFPYLFFFYHLHSIIWGSMRSGLRSGLTHYATVSFLLFHASQSCPFRLLFAKSCSLACLLPWLDLTFHSRLLWRMKISSFSIVWYHRSPIVCPHLFFSFSVKQQELNAYWTLRQLHGNKGLTFGKEMQLFSLTVSVSVCLPSVGVSHGWPLKEHV